MQTLIIILLVLVAGAGWALFLGTFWLMGELIKGWHQILARAHGAHWRQHVILEMYKAQNQGLGGALAAADHEILRLKTQSRPEDDADWWKGNEG